LSNFVLSILSLLDVAPTQLTGTAWCQINSFERLLRHHEAFEGLPHREPTVDLFLFYYYLKMDKSWITVKRRARVNPFLRIRKLERWNRGFFFLGNCSGWFDVLNKQGVRASWNLDVTLPGRRELAPEERALAVKIFEISGFPFFFLLTILFFCFS
jgi:hypothetical protein